MSMRDRLEEYVDGLLSEDEARAFEEELESIYVNDVSRRLRGYVERRLFPICNRCCCLHMTYAYRRKLGRALRDKLVRPDQSCSCSEGVRSCVIQTQTSASGGAHLIGSAGPA